MNLYPPLKSHGRTDRSGDAAARRDAHKAASTPATAVQMKLSRSLNEGAAVRSLTQLGQRLNQRPAVVAQRKLSAALSSRAAIQREDMLDEDELMQQATAATAQREAIQDDDDLLQGKFEPVQRQGSAADIFGNVEDEEPLQGQFTPEQREVMPDEDELLQAKFEAVQRQDLDSGTLGDGEDEEVLQGKHATAQRQEADNDLVQTTRKPVQRQEINQTGLPDQLKAGIESLSGLAMDDVRVHFNSPQPKQLQALAYAQGTDIHVAPGEERHLPHEAWHVAQQKQGRVQPTMQAKGVAINDDAALESEADQLGARAAAMQFRIAPGPALSRSVRGGTYQLNKRDAAKYIRAQALDAINPASFDYWDVLNFVKDGARPLNVRLALIAEWNKGQGPRYTIDPDVVNKAPAVPTAENMAVLKLLMFGPQPEDVGPIHHFNKGTQVATTYNQTGAFMDPEDTTTKASKPKRGKIYKSLGIGEHVLRDHIDHDDATLFSKARAGQANFTWSSDQALVAAVERGRQAFAARAGEPHADEKAVTVPIGALDGYGIVIADDGRPYIVRPRYAKVTMMAKGDFKTAYGITETSKLAGFANAYYAWQPYQG